jgi:hypothetical protein
MDTLTLGIIAACAVVFALICIFGLYRLFLLLTKDRCSRASQTNADSTKQFTEVTIQPFANTAGVANVHRASIDAELKIYQDVAQNTHNLGVETENSAEQRAIDAAKNARATAAQADEVVRLALSDPNYNTEQAKRTRDLAGNAWETAEKYAQASGVSPETKASTLAAAKVAENSYWNAFGALLIPSAAKVLRDVENTGNALKSDPNKTDLQQAHQAARGFVVKQVLNIADVLLRVTDANVQSALEHAHSSLTDATQKDANAALTFKLDTTPNPQRSIMLEIQHEMEQVKKEPLVVPPSYNPASAPGDRFCRKRFGNFAWDNQGKSKNKLDFVKSVVDCIRREGKTNKLALGDVKFRQRNAEPDEKKLFQLAIDIVENNVPIPE